MKRIQKLINQEKYMLHWGLWSFFMIIFLEIKFATYNNYGSNLLYSLNVLCGAILLPYCLSFIVIEIIKLIKKGYPR